MTEKRELTLFEAARALGLSSGSWDRAHEVLTGTGLCLDSRKVNPGDIFIAVPGINMDGHTYLEEVFSKGIAFAIISNPEYAHLGPCLQVQDSRKALSRLAACFYGYPSRNLHVTGVTGTNGKTTIQTILCDLFNRAGHKCLGVGTTGIKAEGLFDKESQTAPTTPDSITLYTAMADVLEADFTNTVMEVSSHALSQCRADDVDFDVCVYTNLTQDHLDYHGNFENYFEAKRRLFQILSKKSEKERTAIINTDCEYGKSLAEFSRASDYNLYTYGEGEGTDIQILSVDSTFTGSTIEIKFKDQNLSLKVPMIGKHNAYNTAAVFGTAVSSGISVEDTISLLKEAAPVCGRLEPVGNSEFGIFVDYAHSADALENVLKALRPLTKNRLWALFGCGGDRDRGKRSLMAEKACTLADCVVVTSDNPRTENPQRIINDILSYEGKYDIVEPDRKLAIEKSIAALEKGDILLIAGKGHEDYQIIGTEKTHFSDQEEVKRVLSNYQGG